MPLPAYCELPVMKSPEDTLGHQRFHQILDSYLLETTTAIALVLGNGRDAAEVASTLRDLMRQNFPTGRTLWIEDPHPLDAEQRKSWVPNSETLVTFLTISRRVSSRMTWRTASKASELSLAMADALAGRVAQ